MIESLVKKNGTEDDGIIKFHFLDEIHFSPDELQELVHSLSYVYVVVSTFFFNSYGFYCVDYTLIRFILLFAILQVPKKHNRHLCW